MKKASAAYSGRRRPLGTGMKGATSPKGGSRNRVSGSRYSTKTRRPAAKGSLGKRY